MAYKPREYEPPFYDVPVKRKPSGMSSVDWKSMSKFLLKSKKAHRTKLELVSFFEGGRKWRSAALQNGEY